jgi:hypothetical protein
LIIPDLTAAVFLYALKPMIVTTIEYNCLFPANAMKLSADLIANQQLNVRAHTRRYILTRQHSRMWFMRTTAIVVGSPLINGEPLR